MKRLRGSGLILRKSLLGGYQGRGRQLGLRQRQRQMRNLHSSVRNLICLLPSIIHAAVPPAHLGHPPHPTSNSISPTNHPNTTPAPNTTSLLTPSKIPNTHPSGSSFPLFPTQTSIPSPNHFPKIPNNNPFLTHSGDPATNPSGIHISLSTTQIFFYPSILPFLPIPCTQPSNPNTYSLPTSFCYLSNPYTNPSVISFTNPCHSCFSHSLSPSNPSIPTVTNSFSYPSLHNP